MPEVARTFSWPYSLPHSVSRPAAGPLHVLDDLDQHAAGPARWVVDGLTLARVEDVDQQANDRAGGVVLAGLLVRLVGETLDQVLVGIAEDVGRDRCVGQGPGREVLDEVGQPAVRQLVLVRPAGVAEDPVQGLRVGLLDLAERRDKRLADVLGAVAHVSPEAAGGDREAVVLREGRELMVAAGLGQRLPRTPPGTRR